MPRLRRITNRLLSFAVTLLLVAVGLLVSADKTTAPSSAATPTPAPVTENSTTTAPASTNPTFYAVDVVVDGDTLKVTIDGKRQTIRVIGIDTPEVVDPRKTVQCFGKEASDQAKSLLTGGKVTLTPDPTQSDRDKYGRLLRYIGLEDGSDFGRRMIADGFAHEYTYNVPYQRQADYKQAQHEAQATSKGLWAATACETPQ